MLFFAFLSLFLVALAFGQGDIVYDAVHNATSIVGTWSSGHQAVITGSGFANPAQETFTYPKTTGVSYSFTDDGFYEIARYRAAGNGSQPHCITAVMNWVHGQYQLMSNGSILLTPFPDGYQQIQATCAPVSNFLEQYNHTELYVSWTIYQDAVRGYTLQLFEFDGRPQVPMSLVSTSPNMLPTQLLRNRTVFRTLFRNAGEHNWSVSSLTGLCSLVAGLGIASLLL